MKLRSNALRGLLPVLLLGGCDAFSSDDQAPDDGFKVTLVKDLSNSEWTSGVFYQAEERTGLQAESVEEAKELLRRISAEGAEVEVAWFKAPSSSCGTPFGIAMQVVVPAALVVRLSEDADQAMPSAFERTSRPGLLCPYYVEKLIPTDRSK